MSLRFAVLGRLAVGGPEPVTVGRRRERCLLGVLLLEAGTTVPVDRLVSLLWDDEPPVTARASLHSHVARLRAALDGHDFGLRLVRGPGGYRADVDPDLVDVRRFRTLLERGRADPDPARRAATLREALELWRGPILAGDASDRLRDRIGAPLQELRLTATELMIDAELERGRHAEVIGELTALTAEHPARERLAAQLMLALYRCGRQTDALRFYRQFSERLADTLGTDPGTDLTKLYVSVLRQDPELGGQAAAPAAWVRCLPRTVGDFTGREAVVQRLVDAAASDGPAVLAVDGMAGSGKTTLALHVASLVGDRFPDAHLFVDLHGHSDHEPLQPDAALLILLRQLGVPAERMPAETAGRVDMWRTELAPRRALVLLDNAASSRQIADLLPASPGVLAVVTSRRRLLGLDGAHTESLPVFTEGEAVALLARIAGDRVTSQPVQAAELVRRCGGLPLALRLAGARLAHRGRWQVADLVRRLGESVLPELAAESRTVAGAFALSFHQLTTPAQQLFRLLGVFPGRSFDAVAAAALAELSLDQADELIDDLVEAHLVEEPEPHVYRLHDLLREYSGMLAAQVPATERNAAVERALDLEIHAALVADRLHIEDALRDLGHPVPLRPDLLVELIDPPARLERTRSSLAAFADAALEAGRPDLVWAMARASWRFLWNRRYHDDIIRLFTMGRHAPVWEGNLRVQALTANYLASAYHLRGRNDQVRALLEECVRLLTEIGAESELSGAMKNLAIVHLKQGNYAEAIDLAERSLRLGYRDTIDPTMRLDTLSGALSECGRHAEAIHIQRRRLLLALERREQFAVGHSLLHLTKMRIRGGDIAPAVAERRLRVVRRELIRCATNGHVADAQIHIGDQLRAQGRYTEAIAEITADLTVMRELDIWIQAQACNYLGRARLGAGDPAGAIVEHQQALKIAGSAGYRIEQARAHLGLGDCLAGTDPAAADQRWREAARIFTELGVPEQADAERRLRGTD